LAASILFLRSFDSGADISSSFLFLPCIIRLVLLNCSNFLSLYNLTISDGGQSNHNGSWEEIAIRGESDAARKNKIRSALFGGGSQMNGSNPVAFMLGRQGDRPASAAA
jgi:hypothetical protein